MDDDKNTEQSQSLWHDSMSPELVRLECLRLAVATMPGHYQIMIEAARALADFVNGKDAKTNA